jgi:predicted RNase H-like HicB family nuclease
MGREAGPVDGRVKPGQDEPKGLKDCPMRYAVVIEKGERSYSAYVPDLPGCVSAGDTAEEVKLEIREAIEFHLEGMREDGLLISKPSSQADYVEVGEPAA